MSFLALATGLDLGFKLVKAATGLFTSDEKRKAAEGLVRALPDATSSITNRIVNHVLQIKGNPKSSHSDMSPEGKIVDYMKTDSDLYVSFLEELLLKQRSAKIEKERPVENSDYLRPLTALTKLAGEKLVKRGNEKQLIRAVQEAVKTIKCNKPHVAGALGRHLDEEELTKDVVKRFCSPRVELGAAFAQEVDSIPEMATEKILDSIPGEHKSEEAIMEITKAAMAKKELL